MSNRILVFAGPEDDAGLRTYAKSIGLTLLHPHAYRMTPQQNERSFEDPTQGGYFSFLPVEGLQRHPHPEIGLCDALDPLILYVRPHYQPPFLVAGQVLLFTDSAKLAKETRPYFNKLEHWARTKWRCREEDSYYIGPDAERLLRAGAKVSYMPPDVTTEKIALE